MLTPEEWTRQRLLQQFIEVLKIPASWISVEKEIWIHSVKKRYDILVHDAAASPLILVECKAPSVELNASVMEQVLRYHIQVPAPYLILANGSEIRCWGKKGSDLQEQADWPLLRK